MSEGWHSMSFLVSTVTGKVGNQVIFQFKNRVPLPVLAIPLPSLSFKLPKLPELPGLPTLELPDIPFKLPALPKLPTFSLKLPSIPFPPPLGFVFPKLPELPGLPTLTLPDLDFELPALPKLPTLSLKLLSNHHNWPSYHLLGFWSCKVNWVQSYARSHNPIQRTIVVEALQLEKPGLSPVFSYNTLCLHWIQVCWITHPFERSQIVIQQPLLECFPCRCIGVH